MDRISDLSDRAFLTDVIEGKQTTIVLFQSEHAEASHLMETRLFELADKYHEVKFAKVDIGKNSDTASHCNLLTFPAILVFEGGREVKKLIGFHHDEELLAALQPWLNRGGE